MDETFMLIMEIIPLLYQEGKFYHAQSLRIVSHKNLHNFISRGLFPAFLFYKNLGGDNPHPINIT